MVQELDRSLAFYTALGFKLERRDGDFAALRFEEREFFLDQRSDLAPLSGPARANVRILTNDVDAVRVKHRKISQAVITVSDRALHG